jgi:carboxypeptidase D
MPRSPAVSSLFPSTSLLPKLYTTRRDQRAHLYYCTCPGTGLSSSDPGAPSLIKTESDVAAHFAGFWKNFVDAFDMHGYDVYLAGESYAGMMIPYIASNFLEHNDSEYYNLKGTLLMDPAIGPLRLMEHAPAAQFLHARAGYFHLNDSFMEDVTLRAGQCGFTEYMEDALTFPPAGEIAYPWSLNGSGAVADPTCSLWSDITQAALWVNPCFDPYHVSAFCPFPSNQIGFPSLGWGPNNYFNRSDVQDALNVGEPRPDFHVCNEVKFGLEASEPATFSVLPAVVERTGNVVIANGELDFLIPSNGTLAAINNMTWQGTQGFESSPFADDFFVPYNPTILPAMEETMNQLHIPTLPVGLVAGGGLYGKTHTERGLTFTSVALAGHQIPQYAPGAAYRLLEFLLGRVNSLTEVGEFTTAGDCVWM